MTTPSDWLADDSLEPVRGDRLEPLYTGADHGELRLPRCAACRTALELEQRVCDVCGGHEVDWSPTEPTGTVHSVTVVHRMERGLVRTGRPYPVADVELAGGHRLVLAPLSPDDPPPPIGARVAIGFRRIGGTALPAFTLDTALVPDRQHPFPEEAP